MASIWLNIASFFGRRQHQADPAESAALEAMRKEFQERYLHFKLLLEANNAALHGMAMLEEALDGQRPITAQALRSIAVEISSNVFTMTRSLQAMAGHGYETLPATFHGIQGRVEAALQPSIDRQPGPWILSMQDAGLAHAAETGAKLATLAQASKDLAVDAPHGFVITASAYHHFFAASGLQEEINRRIQIADATSLAEMHALSYSLQQCIMEASLPQDLADAIQTAHVALEAQCGRPLRLAVRSSALGEDALGASFAGQFRTDLNVEGASLLQHYKEVVASKYGVTAMAYRQSLGLMDEDVAMCVGCLEMVDAQSSGVAYSMDPVLPAEEMLQIHSVIGLPKAVVDGQSAADRFLVSRQSLELRESEIAQKKGCLDMHPETGIVLKEIPAAQQLLPSLSPKQIHQVAELSMRLEAHFGAPQDVEWAFDQQGRLILLQCRPLVIAEAAPGQGETTSRDAPLPEEGATVLASGGQTASPGVGAGPVCLVRHGADALQFPQGGVLVTAQALPRWAPLLQRAAALVSASGSTAGHLANVAREFGVPAIFGIDGAVQLLEQAEDVTVDADYRHVYAGFVEAVLTRKPAPKKAQPMLGSPVYQLLEQTVSHIVPLTLLDPEAPTFHPDHCQTLHDITRYCHEKSVAEMFRRQHQDTSPFPVGLSKQLSLGGKPMQYWVVDLGDGFCREVDGPVVKLQDIASTAMLAFWEGLTAIPWEGPPAMDVKGFLSVLAESTSNPDLEPGRASTFNQQSYFLIARHYMSLQSRTGFHFCTVEALAGPDAGENTCFFSFSGGAASPDRRETRANIIALLLQEQGFDVEVRQDTLNARIEGYPQVRMEQALRQLGHLVQHTRQLDMVMANPDRVAAVRDKLRKQLQGFMLAANKM